MKAPRELRLFEGVKGITKQKYLLLHILDSQQCPSDEVQQPEKRTKNNI